MISPFFKAVGISFIAGAMIVITASAFSCNGGAAEAAPSPQVHPALVSAEQACQAIVKAGAAECIVTEFNPSIDIVSNLARPDAVAFCEAAARFVQANYNLLAGKTWSIRIINRQSMTPSCIERVR